MLKNFMCTSVYSGQRESGESLALHLPLLLQTSLCFQDWILKLCPSIDVTENTMHCHK